MQLIFDSSTELGGADGLGLLAGTVGRAGAAELKVPHIGWSPAPGPSRVADSPRASAEGEPFYFVHSFAPAAGDASDVLGTADYGERFACAVERGNVFGAQFHPEKSSGAGLRLLRNFAGDLRRPRRVSTP